MLSEYLTQPTLLAILAFITIGLIISFIDRPRLPNIPIIGSRKGDWFPLLQARWRNTRNFKSALDQAATQSRPVLVPTVSEGDVVILPHEEVKFITDQPDSVLGFSERAFELLQIDYTFADPTIPRVPLHEKLLRTKLTPKIGSLVPDLAEEAARAFESHWGVAEEWQDVNVFGAMRHIVGRVANRAFVGLPFCRDPELVQSGMAFAVDIPISSTMIKMVWKPLRPFLAPLISIPNYIHTRRFRNILLTEIDRRLLAYDARSKDHNDKPSAEPEPNDFLQWCIEQAKGNGDPYMWRSNTLADRILVVNMATIHATSFASTDAVFDFVSSQTELLDEIRGEIIQVLAENDGRWSKNVLNQLHKLDSALRESMRISSILSTGLGRTVVAKGGLITPSGVHLPFGTKVAVPAYCIMHSDAVYTASESFTPLRFFDQRHEDRGKADYIRRARNALPTTSTDFLVFGHGRHACPGRFFASTVLKLILAHAILHYDFVVLSRKPEGSWMGVTRVPPLKATVRMKRRTVVSQTHFEMHKNKAESV